MRTSFPSARDGRRVRLVSWIAGLAGAAVIFWPSGAAHASPGPDGWAGRAEGSGPPCPRAEAALDEADLAPESRAEMVEPMDDFRVERMTRWSARGHATRGGTVWSRGRHDRSRCCRGPALGPRAPRHSGRGPMGFGPPDSPDAPRGFGAELGRMAARRLDLSPEQRESLEPVIQETAGQMRELHEAFEAGSISAEEAGDRAIRLRSDADARMREILTADQRAKLDDRRGDRLDRRIERRSSQIGRHTDRQAAFYIDRLELDREQASAVRRILEATIPARRDLADRVESDELAPEKAFFLLRQIDRDAEKEIRGRLEPQQLKALDAIETLRDFRGGPGADRPSGPPLRERTSRHGRRGPRF